MNPLDITIDTKAREFLNSLSFPLTEADIIQAFKAGADLGISLGK